MLNKLYYFINPLKIDKGGTLSQKVTRCSVWLILLTYIYYGGKLNIYFSRHLGDLYNQMKYKIDNSIKKPAYLQLYEEIKKDITSGSIPYGSKLPSKRILSEETGVSVITAEHAYSLLCDEGYAESRDDAGSGGGRCLLLSLGQPHGADGVFAGAGTGVPEDTEEITLRGA